MGEMNIIGNVFSLVACIIMVSIGFVKKKEHVVVGLCFQLGFLGVSNFILGAYSGLIGNILGIIRNIVLPKVKKALFWKISFIVVQLVITLLTCDCTVWISWIPFTYAVALTCVLDTKNVNLFKATILVVQGLFFFFDLYYMNVGSMIADLLTVFSNGISIFMSLRKAKQPV